MVYLFIDKQTIKGLGLKKTLLGQYEAGFYQKTYQTVLVDEKNLSIDILASAVKEVVGNLEKNTYKDKGVFLILPQDCFVSFRTTIATDLALSAIIPFLKNKAQILLNIDLDLYDFNYFLEENGNNQKELFFFGIEKQRLKNYIDALDLVGLKFAGLIPEALTYFSLFDKTLRKEKKENILYLSLNGKRLTGYLYDNIGPSEDRRLILDIEDEKNIETVLKSEADNFVQQNKKINRLILSGADSEKIRQDTFTKAVGMWTNPLKKILENFYQEQLKLFAGRINQPVPLLTYDVCFGAFIFLQEHKNYITHRNRISVNQPTKSAMLPSIKLPIKKIAIFMMSFAFSFGLFVLFSRQKNRLDINSFISKKPAAVSLTPHPPTVTLSPTPIINRESVKIEILNGSGIAGKANQLKELLKNYGYSEIITGNADNFDYVNTEILYKTTNYAVAVALKNDLKNELPINKLTEMTNGGSADITIIVGTDFK